MDPFDPVIIANDPERRRPLLEVLGRALEAADPRRAVADAVSREGTIMRIAGEAVNLAHLRRVVVLALGKAASPMAAGLIPSLEDIPVEGVVVSLPGATPVPGLELIAGGHPLPDERSLVGGRRLLRLAETAGRDDLVVVLVSGGGSALAEAPKAGVSLDGLARLTQQLLESGADIEEVNTVRRHLSRLKGGGLAILAEPARVVTLVISDVVGSPLHAIASGPTVPDAGSPQEALAVIDQYELGEAIPPAIVDTLRASVGGERPRPSCPIGVILDGTTVAAAAARGAKDLGLPARLIDEPLTGEARVVGRRLVTGETGPGLTIYSGETTVTVTGEGHGGRNQELALAAAVALDGEDDRIVASLATDGVDGPTDAAGGIVDGVTVFRGRAAGLDAMEHLGRNDSYAFLDATGDLLRTGPTGTNVGDLVIVSLSNPARGT